MSAAGNAVWVAGKRLLLDPTRTVGSGGEAEVFDVGQGLALKLWKTPDHLDYDGLPDEQAAATRRIANHQRKLREFPAALPDRVVAPLELATDRRGQEIRGYTMRLVPGATPLARLADRKGRQGTSAEAATRLLLDLHRTVDALHRRGVVIGDFHDLNVLASVGGAMVIDCDSFQFDRWICETFTERFVDPLLCDGALASLRPLRPHSRESDWYAFAVMVMQSLLFVGPYGGVYRPTEAARQVPQPARPLRRITVFHPEVRYPKPAVPYGVLPDELLHELEQIFVRDRRGPLPLGLLDRLRFTRCGGCGEEHARRSCPLCAPLATAPVKETVTVRGTVTATRVFRVAAPQQGDVIVHAATTGADGALGWVHFQASGGGGRFLREDGRVLFSGALHPELRFGLVGRTTLVGRLGTLLTLTPDGNSERTPIDHCRLVPSFAATPRGRTWIAGGQLWRDGALGAERVGDVLAGQTRFWVGPRFGCGFYRAGGVTVAFVFDGERRGLHDGVKLPPEMTRGEIVDASCHFSADRAWLFVAASGGARLQHHCAVLDERGQLLAYAVAAEGDGGWLGGAVGRGRAAAGQFLFVATDDGIVRVEHEPGAAAPRETRRFPDTEPLVDAGCDLVPTAGGLAVVDGHQIRILRMH